MSQEKKHILGLDLGTNSIGWALVEIDNINFIVRIKCIGSRIIPMSPAEISIFENGGHMTSAAAERRNARQPRRMNERFILRRDRLNYVLNVYSMLPQHYRLELEIDTPQGLRCGHFKKGKEPKIAYRLSEKREGQRDKYAFIFDDAYNEMREDLKRSHGILPTDKIPKDWTLYYLRKKALTEPISMEQLSWLLHSFNKKRGYMKVEGADAELNDCEVRTCKVVSVIKEDANSYAIHLEDTNNSSWTFDYKEDSSRQNVGDFKQVEISNVYDEEGNLNQTKSKISIKEIRQLKVVAIRHEGKKTTYTIDNGWVQESANRQSATMQEGMTYSFICSCDYALDGNRKKRVLALALDSDKKANWAYIKLDTETKIAKYNEKNGTKGVGAYIYANLLGNGKDRLHTKIIGGLVESIEREYYHDEIIAILKKQIELHDNLNDKSLYAQAVNALYPHNESHRRQLMQQGLEQLIADDILHYQRELKSKKSEIDDCRFESYRYTTQNGREVVRPVKAAHTANPYFQEFRIWKFINQLRVLEEANEEHASQIDVTEEYLDFDVRASLFEYMQTHKGITNSVLRQSFMHLPNKGKGYVWNYESDHEEKGNETRYDLMVRLKRVKALDWQVFLAATHIDNGKLVTNEYMLWHFFYSVKQRKQRDKGLCTLIERLLAYADMNVSLANEIVKQLMALPAYKSSYCAYSEKALLKLLPLMRCGKYWNEEDVAKLTGVLDDKECQGLMEHDAVNVIYADQLMAVNKERWQTPHDIRQYLKKGFRHNALKNPVVEKVVREMLMTVHDIWECQLRSDENFHFDEIHVELGRELQKSPKQKQSDISHMKDNRAANKRARMILSEMGLEANSPFMREKYRIYEECVLDKIRFDKKETEYNFEDAHGNMHTITKAEIMTIQTSEDVEAEDIRLYRRWLDKRFSSPYTGKEISFSDIFNGQLYQREHILPRERVTLNSFQNLVMCEAAINKLKSAMTGMEFIKKYGGRNIGGIRIQTETEYRQWVHDNVNDPQRREIYLSEKVPERFTNNQLNNTRYISRLAMSLLSRIVRDNDEQGAISKNMLSVNGSVTATLRRDWHLGEVWNELITPRFRRMNKVVETVTGLPSTLFGMEREIRGKKVFVPDVPEKYRDTFEKKRIDHRHHALDALVVALTERAHIQYLNNVTAEKDTRDAVSIRKALKAKYTKSIKKEDGTKDVFFLPPMQYNEGGKTHKYRYAYQNEVRNGFETITLKALQDMLVSFKSDTKLTSPRKNLYLHWNEEQQRIVPTSERGLESEQKYGIRQKMTPKETIYGRRIINGDTYICTRWSHTLDMFAKPLPDKLKTVEDKLKELDARFSSIADKAIAQILKNYAQYCDFDLERAFSPDGIAYMNANISQFTPNKKVHAPIYKVALLKRSVKAYALSSSGVKSRQFYEENSNIRLFMYPDKSSKVQTMDMYLRGVEMKSGYSFSLVKNDLVYLPTARQQEFADAHKGEGQILLKELGADGFSPDRFYRVESFDPGTNKAKLLCMPATMAQMIFLDKEGIEPEDMLLHLVDHNLHESEEIDTSELQRRFKGKIRSEILWTSDKAKGPKPLFSNDITIRDVCWKVKLSRIGEVEEMITQQGVVIKA